MVAVPLFADQPANARRIDELGVGVQVDAAGLTAEDWPPPCSASSATRRCARPRSGFAAASPNSRRSPTSSGSSKGAHAVVRVTECAAIFGATHRRTVRPQGRAMSATTTPEESVAVPELEDFDFPLADGAACRIDDPDCEACQ
jgi:hypothetical protein